eukprot:SAG11_NODE_2132_length_3775_cov_3.636017_2_plen_223_part_00
MAAHRDPYSTAIDIWSIGCIFAELMSRKTLFPGRTVNQQLDLITRFVGSPTETDLKQLKDGPAKKMLQGWPKRAPKDFSSVLQEGTEKALLLLKQLLRFNPSKRISAADGVEHEYFDDIRHLAEAQIPEGEVPAKGDLTFDFEVSKKVTREQLRRHMYKEVSYHRGAEDVAPEPAPELAAQAVGMDARAKTPPPSESAFPSSSASEPDDTPCSPVAADEPLH